MCFHMHSYILSLLNINVISLTVFTGLPYIEGTMLDTLKLQTQRRHGPYPQEVLLVRNGRL